MGGGSKTVKDLNAKTGGKRRKKTKKVKNKIKKKTECTPLTNVNS